MTTFMIKPDPHCPLCGGCGVSARFIAVATGGIDSMACLCITEQLPEEFNAGDEVVINYCPDPAELEYTDDSGSRLILRLAPEHEAEDRL